MNNGIEFRSRTEHPRVQEMFISRRVVAEFMSRTVRTTVEELEQVPLSRFVMSHTLVEVLGAGVVDKVYRIMGERTCGALTFRVPDEFAGKGPCIRLLTAFSHLLGTPNSEPYSQEFYGFDRMSHVDHVAENLWGPYKVFPLHTAGSPMAEPCDWFAEVRLTEKCAVNGRRRLLHIDDWEDGERLSQHSLARHPLLFRMPVGADAARSLLHPAVQGVKKSIFYGEPHRPFARFIDCFVIPQAYEESVYVASVASSLRQTTRAVSLPLPPVSFVILNNRVWFHGREAYSEHPEFEREILLAHGKAYPGSALGA